MWDNEGTVDENDHGPDFKSGDVGDQVHGYSITKDGERYDESPKRTGDAQGIADAIKASRTSLTAWMDYYDQNWPAMHTWLAQLTSGERTRLFERCRFSDLVFSKL